MTGKIPPKGTPERSAYFRELVEKRWGKPRPPVAPKDKRGARAFPAGSEEEQIWEARARELELSDKGMSRTSWRRMLKRLADADVARRAEEAAALVSGGPAGDTDLLSVHYEREVARLRARAERDRQFAAQHDREADEAAAKLAAHLRRQGRA